MQLEEENIIKNQKKKKLVKMSMTIQASKKRAKEIGCTGVHSHDQNGKTILCHKTHDDYMNALQK